MDQASPSTSGLYGEGEGEGGVRGVGGKFRKPPARRLPMTPHDRPISNRSQASGQPLDGGWLSKLVDPAYRLIAGGATRIFPSIFSKSSFSAASTTEDHDSGGSEVEETAYDGSEKCTLNLEIFKPGETDSKEGAEIWNKSSYCDQLGHGKISNSPHGTEYSKIEQLVKGRRFSRDELNRLTEILNSRVGDLSNVHLEEKEQFMDIKGEGKEAESALKNSRMSIEEKQERLDGARVRTSMPLLPAKEAVGASPIDIARAYMRTQVSEVGTASRMIISREETSFPQSDGFASPSIPLHSRKSSVCWPGAMVQDQHDYSTPQSSRYGYGLHHFQRTPYSRTNYSKSKHDLTRSLADKKRYLNILSTPRLQSETTLFGKDDTLHDTNGSVGPIHRGRRTFVSQARPKGSGSLWFPQNGPLQEGDSSLSKGFSPAMKKNLEVGSTSTHTDFQSVDNTRSSSKVDISAVQSSNPAVRLILEHLDRNKPTPKEKSAELQLATEWKKSSSSRVTDSVLEKDTRMPHLEGYDLHKSGDFVVKGSFAQGNARENSNFTVKPLERSISEAADGNKDSETCSTLNGSNGSQIKCTNESTSFKLKNSIKQKGMNHIWPVHNQSERQGISNKAPNIACSEFLKKPPFHPSGTKPNLPSISVCKPSSGFTFPISTSSGILPEPPTPSIMPSTLASRLP